jgi:hypothetical protein
MPVMACNRISASSCGELLTVFKRVTVNFSQSPTDMGGMGMVNFVFGQLATGHWPLAAGHRPDQS